MSRHRMLWLVGVLVGGLALPALAQTNPAPTRHTPVDANQARQSILRALASSPVTAPYQFWVEHKNGRFVLTGRVGTTEIHDVAVRIALDSGLPITDQLVIDTSSRFAAAALAARGLGPMAAAFGPVANSAVGSNSYIYPPPLFGRYDDPFFGMEPPIISYPPWWRSVVYREPLDSNLTGAYPVPPVGSIPAPPGMPPGAQPLGQSTTPAPGQSDAPFSDALRREAPSSATGPDAPVPDGTVELTIGPHGVAVLRGTVDTLDDRIAIGQRLSNAPGISEVRNLLSVREGSSPAPPPPPEPAVPHPGASPAAGSPTVEPPAAVPTPPVQTVPTPPSQTVPTPSAPASPRSNTNTGPSAAGSDDMGLSERVVKALERRPTLAGQPIRVSVRDGMASLSGRVPTVLEAMIAYRAAEQTPGVRDVADRLEFVVPNAETRNPLLDKGRPDDVEPYLQAQIRRQIGDVAHVDRVRAQGDDLVISGILRREEDRSRVEATLRSMAILRGFRLHPEFTVE
jgi:BON domain